MLAQPAVWSAAAPAPLPARPNIVFILTDDLDTRSVAYMPLLGSLLIERGVTFTQFFVTYALCCPSRSTILTGQYVHNHRVLTNTRPNGGYPRFLEQGHERSTVGTWLQAAGYRTAFLGKYLNGYPLRGQQTHVPPGWDEWNSPAGGTPYANFNFRMNENGRIVPYGRAPEDSMTDLLARKAIAFIRQAAAAGRPFFVHLSTYAPHAPATPAPRHEDAFSGVAAPRSPAFNEADTSDKPAWLRSRAPLSPRQTSDIDEHFRVRLQSLLAVDEMIAALVDVLAATGQLSRTYIFFTSDNGWHLGEHRIAAGKNTPYEESIRVPHVVRGLAVPEGRTLALLACNNDLAPTFAQIAGVPIPERVDGRSLVPLLGAAPPAPEAWRQAIAIEHYREQPDGLPQAAPERSPGGRGIPEFHGVRGRDLVYVEYATGERELYDLARDPYQMESIHATEIGVLGPLSARLAALKRCSGASCRLAEDAPLPTLTGR
ncbi:MAG: sulfatase [Armatimonadota bacterium]|nr:sulfatase [Armatimonadota bacterium]